MNDPKIAIARLNEIAEEGSRELPLAERCALYAAARFLLDDLRAHATRDDGRIDAYLSEKLGDVRWHIGAQLGFDVDNGKPEDQHRSWSYGALNTVRDIFAERFADED